MLIICLRSRLPILDQDPMALYVHSFNGWLVVRNDCVDYYINADRAYMLYIYDSHIERIPRLDYIH